MGCCARFYWTTFLHCFAPFFYWVVFTILFNYLLLCIVIDHQCPRPGQVFNENDTRTMNNTVIVTTPAQLREIVADEVAAILPKLADFRRKNEPVETDGMNIEGAARFLTGQGIPTTRATLYNLVYKNSIPHKKFGRRTVFSKKELLAWIESRTVHSEDRRTAAALRIAESANRK